MLAWMSAESLTRTHETGLATFFSRSRGKLWFKGEESGHVQKVVEIRLDCDSDAILLGVPGNALGPVPMSDPGITVLVMTTSEFSYTFSFNPWPTSFNTSNANPMILSVSALS